MQVPLVLLVGLDYVHRCLSSRSFDQLKLRYLQLTSWLDESTGSTNCKHFWVETPAKEEVKYPSFSTRFVR